MKTFNNVKFKVGNPKDKMENYVDVLLIAINMPPQGGAFTPKQNFERTGLYRKLNKFKNKEVVELEDADFTTIREAFYSMGFTLRSDEISDMYEYIEGIK